MRSKTDRGVKLLFSYLEDMLPVQHGAETC